MSSSTATSQQHHKQQKYKTKQTLYIIRHGIAYHNLSIKVKLKSKDGPCDDGGDATSRGKFTYKYQHPDKRDPKYTDSKLVLPRAHQQARKAGRRLRKILQNNNIDECSVTNSSDDSCTRTVRSMTGKTQPLTCVFVSPLTRCLETAYFVMNELMDDDDNMKRTKNDEIKVSTNPPPWICKEDLREAFGIHYSDKRSCKSSLKVCVYVQSEKDMFMKI
jgi:broad specificity phosphatase PhoE